MKEHVRTMQANILLKMRVRIRKGIANLTALGARKGLSSSRASFQFL